MSKWTFSNLGVFCLTLGTFAAPVLTTGRLQAQTTPPAAASHLVAVVDLPKVFDGHPTFKTKLETIQQQLKQLEKEFESKQAELSSRGKQLSDLNPTSPDYKRLEAELARQMADLQIQARQAKKDFLQREALQYYTSYNEITSAVHRVAERHNIGLVLRFDSSDIDSSDPQAVAHGINRAVVVQRNLDITQLVVNELQLAAAKSPIRAPRR